MSGLARRRRAFDIWPGFVDALASLIMVMILVMLIFAIGQFVLSDTLAGKNRALDALNAQVAELAKTLSLAQDSESRTRCESEGTRCIARRDQRRTRSTQEQPRHGDARKAAKLDADIAVADRTQAATRSDKIASMSGQLDQSKQDLVKQTDLNAAATAQVELLNRQMAAIREQLGKA